MPSRQALNKLKLDLLSTEGEILRHSRILEIARAENRLFGQTMVVGTCQILCGSILIAGYLYLSSLSAADWSFGFFNGMIALMVLGRRALKMTKALNKQRELGKIERAVDALEKQRERLEMQLDDFEV